MRSICRKSLLYQLCTIRQLKGAQDPLESVFVNFYMPRCFSPSTFMFQVELQSYSLILVMRPLAFDLLHNIGVSSFRYLYRLNTTNGDKLQSKIRNNIRQLSLIYVNNPHVSVMVNTVLELHRQIYRLVAFFANVIVK